MAGDVASRTACEVLASYVRDHHDEFDSKTLLEGGIQAANRQVHREAKRREDRHGMGTTVVAVALGSDGAAVVAHVGDSRAYLIRDGRLQLLTRDHTIVADLLAKKIITPGEAEHHPYSNVLSRNLGSKPRARIDVTELPLRPGDRLLLCSDGLTGYASTDAIEQIVGGRDAPDNVAQDLIELALRGGGGDNVTAVIVDTGGGEVPQDTQVIRTSGALAWWHRREKFLAAAQRRGLCDSPVCAVLSPEEALEIVAGNLCEAIFSDLEQTTGINVWTYAENLAKGWFDQEGDYDVLRRFFDILREAAQDVLVDIANEEEPYAMGLEIAVTRGLTVAEMAIGGLLADRLRHVEAELVDLRAHRDLAEAGDTTAQTFADQPTVPVMATLREDPAPPEVAERLEKALASAREELVRQGERAGASDCLDRAHLAALEPLGPADIELTGRELMHARSGENSSITPLFDALDQARRVHIQCIAELDGDREVCAAALRRVATAHRNLMYSLSFAVVEHGMPVSEALRAAVHTTAELHARVHRGEAKLAELERRSTTEKVKVAGGRPRGRP